MTTTPRFQLYVKAGEDGTSLGDCPFSQRVAMFARLSLKPENLEVVPVNTTNKPESFLALNPEGKVPVLVDRQMDNKVILDSAEIIKYINQLSPKPDLQAGYTGPGSDAASGVFPKFAAMMKNKDPSQDNQLKEALTTELTKLNTYLTEQRGYSDGYILCSNLCELDCQILPKLRHVQVAGKQYKNYDIPAELKALLSYIKCGEANPVFQATCPPDKEIVWGWSKFFS